MTIASTKSSITLIGNGVNKTWDFDFRVWTTGQVAIWLTDLDGLATKITSDFSVTLNANQDATPGGTVTYPVSGDAIAAGYSLSVLRDMGFVQPIDLQKNQGFDPAVLESAMDQATAERQQLKEAISRAVSAAPGQQSAEFLINLTALRDAAAVSATASEVSRQASGISAAASEVSRLAAVAAQVLAEYWAGVAQTANPTSNPTSPVQLNENKVTANITIPADYNAVSAGPITINNGVTVTAANGSNWAIV